MPAHRIKKIVILGGGTAGWMTAASLSEHFRHSDLRITLIESDDIGTIGVGEATIPSIRRFYADLKLSDADVMRATQATCKLGIKFVDWHKKNSAFFHPFGLYGQDIKHVGFIHFWLKLRDMGLASDLESYSLGCQLAQHDKFAPPSGNPKSPLSIFDWALHFDAGLFAQLMKKTSINNEVLHKTGTVCSVKTRLSDGFIEALRTDSGEEITGELFIDCSGFRATLIEGTLNAGFEDWHHYLPCDSAIAAQSKPEQAPRPYTISTALPAGWQWRIPLQHRDGCGYVFSRSHISSDEAQHQLLNGAEQDWLSEPRELRFRAGRRKQAWVKNCIAVGLSAGFLEPLESTSIALIENAITRIKMLFPDTHFHSSLIEEFNEMTRQEYESSRDFIILHYHASIRDDSPFWRDLRSINLPDRLHHKIETYKNRGHLVKYRWEIFQNPSWVALYSGNNIFPESYDPWVDAFDVEYLQKVLSDMEQSINQGVSEANSHLGFLKESNIWVAD